MRKYLLLSSQSAFTPNQKYLMPGREGVITFKRREFCKFASESMKEGALAGEGFDRQNVMADGVVG